MTDGNIYGQSYVEIDGTSYALTLPDSEGKKYLLVEGDSENFEGNQDGTQLRCTLSSHNAAQLRETIALVKTRSIGSSNFGWIW